MSTILITGGTGLIGKELTAMLLNAGYQVIILTREPQPLFEIGTTFSSQEIQPIYAHWNVNQKVVDINAFQQADYVIHLAGAGVADKRWTSKRKSEIVESRIKSSELLVHAIKAIPNKIKAVICASAIGWYGRDETGRTAFVETTEPGNDFLAETCRSWEQSTAPIASLGKRLVTLRTGIVLSKDGGALSAFKKPIRFGIAAILSSGKQIISWIHTVDLCRIYLAAINDDRMNGCFNAVSPNPVNNKALTMALAKKMRGIFFIPMYIPAFVIKMLLGEMGTEVLKSATVSAQKIKNAGFQFLYPTIESALVDM